MKTLYDFLGALPDDDAESLRAAFRRAAKDAHPDINPADPDAALKFRQIVRANEILSDEKQRTAYDHLLRLARLEQEAAPKRAAIERIVGVACGVIAVAGISVICVEGYRLFLLMNGTPPAPAQITQVFRHEPAQAAAEPAQAAAEPAQAAAEPAQVAAEPAQVAAEPAQVAAEPAQAAAEPAQAAAVTTELSDTLDQSDRHDVPEAVDVAEAVGAARRLDEIAEDFRQAMAMSVVATAQGAAGVAASANIPAIRDFATNDAKHYRERGVLAYNSGDLYLALVDFNLAIQFDPGFSDAYIDRAIVFFRMGDQKRAFADVAHAKRIHLESNRNGTPPAASAP